VRSPPRSLGEPDVERGDNGNIGHQATKPTSSSCGVRRHRIEETLLIQGNVKAH
jgi:hypothetical protein